MPPCSCTLRPPAGHPGLPQGLQAGLLLHVCSPGATLHPSLQPAASCLQACLQLLGALMQHTRCTCEGHTLACSAPACRWRQAAHLRQQLLGPLSEIDCEQTRLPARWQR